MASTTKPARPSEREVPIPYREVKHLVSDRFPVPMATHGTGKGNGGPKFYPSIQGLRLSDGTERYLCTAVADCQHTYSTWGKVRFHIGQDHPNPRKTARRARRAAVESPAAELVLPEPTPAPVPEPKPVVAPVVVPTPDTPMTEAGLDGMVRTFSALAESRNGWRARAETAEKLAAAEKERADRAEKNLGELQEQLRKLAEV